MSIGTRNVMMAILILTGILVGGPGRARPAGDTRSGEGPTGRQLDPYVAYLRQHARPPLDFVIEKIGAYDLIVFDDAWHSCAEPFEFYQRLIRTPEFHRQVKYVFIEVLPINKQPCVDAYLRSRPEDATLLYPAFQDDLGGSGWAPRSYFDLLHAIWEVNQGLAEDERIRVVAVNAACYWPEIATAEDVALFRRSLLGNDYTMYRVIVDEMAGFDGAHKGIFLTNTRHAYKGIRDQQGRLYWNVGTFLHQRHPGKTYSIRFHNMALSIESERPRDEAVPETTSGMERVVFNWIRMGDGLWDSAFETMGNEPMAFSLEENVFGAHPYVGNLMLNVAPGQTMSDANDAIIFLAPLEDLHNTATSSNIYTPEFKRELARRYGILYTQPQLASLMEEAGVTTLEALVDSDCAPRPRRPIPQAQSLPPKDAWRDGED